MPICKAGWPFIIGSALAGAVLVGLAHLLGSSLIGALAGIMFLGAAFCAFFFRDPPRHTPSDDRLVIAPGDGKILEIVEDQVDGVSVWLIRIFLSVFEAHLQRSPVSGRVQALKYKKGRFLDARDPKAPFENEQNRIEIVPTAGPVKTTIVVTQIAGLIARRICCWVKEGQTVKAGDRIGLIRFGSQVDITVPKTLRLKVKAGDHVTAGESVIAEAV